jgi:hypothetical protein
MPAIAVSVDGIPVATVCTEGYDVLTVRVGGTRINDEFAELDVSGGSHPDQGESTYLTWVNSVALKPGQTIRVALLESGATSHAGKTIKELFPEEEIPSAPDFMPTPEVFDNIRAMPRLRDGYSFRFGITGGMSFTGHTAPEEHGFGFTVLWNSRRPERASVSLHSYTLEGLEQQSPMRDYVQEHIHFGQEVSFELNA